MYTLENRSTRRTICSWRWCCWHTVHQGNSEIKLHSDNASWFWQIIPSHCARDGKTDVRFLSWQGYCGTKGHTWNPDIFSDSEPLCSYIQSLLYSWYGWLDPTFISEISQPWLGDISHIKGILHAPFRCIKGKIKSGSREKSVAVPQFYTCKMRHSLHTSAFSLHHSVKYAILYGSMHIHSFTHLSMIYINWWDLFLCIIYSCFTKKVISLSDTRSYL